MIEQAVSDCLAENPVSAFFQKSEVDGQVTSVCLNASACTTFQLAVERRILQDLESGWEYHYTVPLGALFGSTAFMTAGPSVPLSLQLFGTAETALGTEMSSVGINQTRYRLILTISCALQTGLGKQAQPISVHGSYTVAELMISGKVPQVDLRLAE
jgi:hypothetical protein